MTTTKTKAKGKRSVYAPVRHAFLVQVTGGDGAVSVKPRMARVRLATKPVTLVLREEHVARSISLDGRGDTGRCAMAICTYGHAQSFPHNVEGHVDWQYSRAFIVSRVDSLGLPTECYAYEHTSEIARRQDAPARKSDGKTGQQLLLEKIRKDGPVMVTLKPYRQRSAPGRSGGRTLTGARDPLKARGARLRYAVAHLGAQPA
jgi:hypothetical protein